MKRRFNGKTAALTIAAAVSVLLASCGTPIVDRDKIGDEKTALSRVDAPASEAGKADSSEKAPDEQSTPDSKPDDTDTSTEESTPDLSTPDESIPEESTPEKKPEPTSGKAVVHLSCAGDNLIHDNIYVEARKEDGTYDFSKCYARCKKLIEGSDIAILNQETLVNDAFEPSTFPLFSTPTAVGDAVVDFGFNVISMSNNHVLDKGSEGLISSLDYWDTKDVVHYGAYRDEADSEDIRIKEVNGITFAFLGYMEHTNGIYLADGEPGKVVYISDTETVKRQVQKADKMADVVVVSCHFGTEVYNEINAMQINFSDQLVEWGADLIIGTQAHALSTCKYLDKPDGGQAFVYYGLGNFLHTMYDADNADGQSGKSLIGIFGKLDVVKDYDNGGKITFENIKAIPVISHYEGESWDSMWYNCYVCPYGDYTDEEYNRHMMHVRSGVTRADFERYISFIPKEFLAYE
ncbi:MAG: CapA family protein [Ruminococcus sp.]|nr:CapA family protein [Ruminococcus sp.]